MGIRDLASMERRLTNLIKMILFERITVTGQLSGSAYRIGSLLGMR